jgi:hypothetical protein
MGEAGTGVERAERYMALAARMEASAEHASHPAICEAYLELAGKWLRLAEQAAKGQDIRGDHVEPAAADARPLGDGWPGR